jgi:FG-GAP repeat
LQEYWVYRQTPRASDPAAGDWSGPAVAIDAGTALIGAQSDETVAGPDAGSVHAFGKVGGAWIERAKLTASAGVTLDRFGWRLALDGDTAIVAVGSAAPLPAFCAFRRSGDTWTQEDRFQIREPSNFDAFGQAVALACGSLAIGAPGDDPGPTEDAGATYVFDRSANGWTQHARVTAPAPQNGARFGDAVSMSDTTLVIGAPGVNAPRPVSNPLALPTRNPPARRRMGSNPRPPGRRPAL